MCFQMIVSGGLDKKLYIYDPGVKKPVYCVPYEAPFASLAFRDDGNTLAAGTNSGRVVFYDVRGRPQPFTILRAYSASEVRRDFLMVQTPSCTDLILFLSVLCASLTMVQIFIL